MLSVEQTRQQTRPHDVDVAVKLLYASLTVQFLLSVANDFLTGALFSFGGLFGLLLFFWLYWALIRLIDRGHKKALIIFLAINILLWAIALFVASTDISLESYRYFQGIIAAALSNWFVDAIVLACAIANLIGLVLLFQKQSSAWFDVAQAET